jgi:5-methylcytosine-specific restriction endonuclease McrA
MDHLIPVVRGGKSVQGNLVPACKDCNSKKKYLLPAEWEEYITALKEGPACGSQNGPDGTDPA